MSRDARVKGDVLVQKRKLTKFCFEALKFEHYTNVKTSFCLSVTHIDQNARFLNNENLTMYESYFINLDHKLLKNLDI